MDEYTPNGAAQSAGFAAFKQDEEGMYADFRRKMNLQAAYAQIKKIEYNLADVTGGLASIRAACADANTLQLGGVCVAPSYVKQCASFLGARAMRKTSLVACIGYPHGGDTTQIKVKAVKQAINDGADEVEVTAPISQIRDGNFAYVRRELKKLRRAARRVSLRISADSSLLSGQDLIRLCCLVADCRINSMKTGSGTYGAGEGTTIADIRAAVKDKCTIKADGISSVTELSAAVDMGAAVVGSTNAPAVARHILSAATSQSTV